MRKAALLAAFAVVGLVGPAAGAQVSYTLDNPTVTVAMPGTVPFTGTVFNGTGATIFIQNALASSALPFGPGGFGALIGTPIAPGGSVSATLFSVLVDASTAPGLYPGFFNINVGPSFPPGGGSQTLSATFGVVVTAVPEPGTASLLALGAAGLAMTGFHRRRTSR